MASGAARAAGATAGLCAALWLTGCAAPAPRVEALPITAAGRLSIRVDALGARPAQSVSVAFEWRGDGDRGELTLRSPLGTQVAQATWSPGDARLVTPEGQARFDTLEALAERALGEPMPLAAWPDWLAGRPWPQAPSVAWPGGADSGFDQLGWGVDLSRFGSGRIEARRAAAPSVVVRIVLDRDDPKGGARP